MNMATRADELAARFKAAVLTDVMQQLGAENQLRVLTPSCGLGGWMFVCNMDTFAKALDKFERQQNTCWLDTSLLLTSGVLTWHRRNDACDYFPGMTTIHNQLLECINKTPRTVAVILVMYPGCVVHYEAEYRVVSVMLPAPDTVPDQYMTSLLNVVPYMRSAGDIPHDLIRQFEQMTCQTTHTGTSGYDPAPFTAIVTGSRKKACGHCGKQAARICTACGTVRYCNQHCQKLAWPAHKLVCARDKAMVQMAIHVLHVMGPSDSQRMQSKR